MKYFWIFLLPFLFIGCSQKNPRLKVVQESVRVYEGEVKVGEDRFGVDAADNTSVFGEKALTCEIYFKFNSFQITPNMKTCIEQNAKLLNNSQKLVTLEGNCDEIGSKTYNYKLGLKRAKSVKNALINRGVKSSKINVLSHGKNNPICTIKNQKCRAKNRRVDFIFSK